MINKDSFALCRMRFYRSCFKSGGHSVHSPYVFSLITDVIALKRYAYYGEENLMALYHKETESYNASMIRALKLAYRLIARYQVTTFAADEELMKANKPLMCSLSSVLAYAATNKVLRLTQSVDAKELFEWFAEGRDRFFLMMIDSSKRKDLLKQIKACRPEQLEHIIVVDVLDAVLLIRDERLHHKCYKTIIEPYFIL